MPQNSKQVQFQKEKETKNTVKFTEAQNQGEPPIIGTLYVQKWFVGNAANLTVTVEVRQGISGSLEKEPLSMLAM